MPDWKPEIRRRLAELTLEPLRELDIVEELAQHLDEIFDEARAQGATEEEATRSALEALDAGDWRAQLGRVPGTHWTEPPVLGAPSGSLLRDAWQDLRFGARMLRRRPGFTAAAIATLALGIGPLAAVFTLAYALLVKSLPYRDPDRLVMVWNANREKGSLELPLSAPRFFDWQGGNDGFERMGAYMSGNVNVGGPGEPEVVTGAAVSADFLATFGVPPFRGRAFLRDEDRAGAAPAVVLGHELWRRRFGGDPAAVGSRITLDGEVYTVVGVMPPGFAFPSNAELWTALAFDLSAPQFNPGNNFLRVVGRLKPGVSVAAAQAQLATVSRDATATGVNLVPLREQLVGRMRTPLLLLLGAMGFVLLIACANVANLLLVRAAARQREVAIRTALGASRSRLLRQLVAEHVLLAALGGAAGLALAAGGVTFLAGLDTLRIPAGVDVAVDLRVVAAVLGATALVGVVFGALSALRTQAAGLAAALKDGVGHSVSLAPRPLRSGLLVAQIALSFVLLAGAGLLIRSLAKVRAVDPGFQTDGVLTATVSLSAPRYADMARRIEVVEQVVDRLGAAPGVRQAAASAFLPLSGQYVSRRFAVDGRPLPEPGREPYAHNNAVSPDFFRALGIPLLAGRAFTRVDGAQAPPVAVVNRAFARQTFPGEDAVGKRIRFYSARDPQPAWREIVGVVGDMRQVGLETEARPEIYVPTAQNAWSSMVFYLRTDGDPLVATGAARDAVRSVDAEQPVARIATLDEVLAGSIAERRGLVLLLTLFAGLALALAAVGIYGVMSDSVSQRTHEIGIRMAIGARAGDVVKLIVRQGAVLTLLGAGLGLAGAVALTRTMASLLFEVPPVDPLTLLAVGAVLAAVAVLACYLPARRATRIDPLAALRSE